VISKLCQTIRSEGEARIILTEMEKAANGEIELQSKLSWQKLIRTRLSVISKFAQSLIPYRELHQRFFSVNLIIIVNLVFIY